MLCFQEGVTPILLAVMSNHPSVVSLLKDKYGQLEPTPEEVVRVHSHMQILCKYVLCDNMTHKSTFMG